MDYLELFERKGVRFGTDGTRLTYEITAALSYIDMQKLRMHEQEIYSALIRRNAQQFPELCRVDLPGYTSGNPLLLVNFTAAEAERLVSLRRAVIDGTRHEQTQESLRYLFARWLVQHDRLNEGVEAGVLVK